MGQNKAQTSNAAPISHQEQARQQSRAQQNNSFAIRGNNSKFKLLAPNVSGNTSKNGAFGNAFGNAWGNANAPARQQWNSSNFLLRKKQQEQEAFAKKIHEAKLKQDEEQRNREKTWSMAINNKEFGGKSINFYLDEYNKMNQQQQQKFNDHIAKIRQNLIGNKDIAAQDAAQRLNLVNELNYALSKRGKAGEDKRSLLQKINQGIDATFRAPVDFAAAMGKGLYDETIGKGVAEISNANRENLEKEKTIAQRLNQLYQNNAISYAELKDAAGKLNMTNRIGRGWKVDEKDGIRNENFAENMAKFSGSAITAGSDLAGFGQAGVIKNALATGGKSLAKKELIANVLTDAAETAASTAGFALQGEEITPQSLALQAAMIAAGNAGGAVAVRSAGRFARGGTRKNINNSIEAALKGELDSNSKPYFGKMGRGQFKQHNEIQNNSGKPTLESRKVYGDGANLLEHAQKRFAENPTSEGVQRLIDSTDNALFGKGSEVLPDNNSYYNALHVNKNNPSGVVPVGRNLDTGMTEMRGMIPMSGEKINRMSQNGDSGINPAAADTIPNQASVVKHNQDLREAEIAEAVADNREKLAKAETNAENTEIIAKNPGTGEITTETELSDGSKLRETTAANGNVTAREIIAPEQPEIAPVLRQQLASGGENIAEEINGGIIAPKKKGIVKNMVQKRRENALKRQLSAQEDFNGTTSIKNIAPRSEADIKNIMSSGTPLSANQSGGVTRQNYTADLSTQSSDTPKLFMKGAPTGTRENTLPQIGENVKNKHNLQDVAQAYNKYGDDFYDHLNEAQIARYEDALDNAPRDHEGRYTDPITGETWIDEVVNYDGVDAAKIDDYITDQDIPNSMKQRDFIADAIMKKFGNKPITLHGDDLNPAIIGKRQAKKLSIPSYKNQAANHRDAKLNSTIYIDELGATMRNIEISRNAKSKQLNAPAYIKGDVTIISRGQPYEAQLVIRQDINGVNRIYDVVVPKTKNNTPSSLRPSGEPADHNVIRGVVDNNITDDNAHVKPKNSGIVKNIKSKTYSQKLADWQKEADGLIAQREAGKLTSEQNEAKIREQVARRHEIVDEGFMEYQRNLQKEISQKQQEYDAVYNKLRDTLENTRPGENFARVFNQAKSEKAQHVLRMMEQNKGSGIDFEGYMKQEAPDEIHLVAQAKKALSLDNKRQKAADVLSSAKSALEERKGELKRTRVIGTRDVYDQLQLENELEVKFGKANQPSAQKGGIVKNMLPRTKAQNALTDALRNGAEQPVDFGKLSTRKFAQVNEILAKRGQALLESPEVKIHPAVVQKLIDKRIGLDKLTPEQVADIAYSAVHARNSKVMPSRYEHIVSMSKPKTEKATPYAALAPYNGQASLKSIYKRPLADTLAEANNSMVSGSSLSPNNRQTARLASNNPSAGVAHRQLAGNFTDATTGNTIPNNTGNVNRKTGIVKGMKATKSESNFNPAQYVQEMGAEQKAALKGQRPTLNQKKEVMRAKWVDDLAPIEDRITDKTARFEMRNQLDRTRRADSISQAFTHDHGLDDLIQGFRSNREMKEFNQLLIAKHARELELNGVKTGRNLEKDANLIKALEGKYSSQLKQARAYSDALLEQTVDYGLINKETARMLREKYPDYMPFDRIFSEDEMKNLYRGKGAADASLSQQSVVQRIKGSARVVDDPLAAMVNKTADVMAQGERNRAAKMLTDFAKNPDNPFGLRELGKNEGANGRPTISFLDNGTKRTFLADAEVAEAAKHMNREQIGLLGKIIAAPTRVLRLGATGVNVSFTGANIVKDYWGAAMNSANGKSALNPKTIAEALTAAFHHKGELYYEMMREGVTGTSFELGRNSNITLKNIRSQRNLLARGLQNLKPNQWLRTAENTIGRSEDFGRAVQYLSNKKAALRKGISEAEARKFAADQARYNSTNFMRHGDYGRALNIAVPYANAGIQGQRIMLRRFKEQPARMTVKTMLGVAVPMAGAWLIAQNDPETQKIMENIPDYEKDANILLGAPGKKPYYNEATGRWENIIKIPVPAQYTAMNRRIRETIEGDNSLKGWAGDISQLVTTVDLTEPAQAASEYMPQGLKLLAEPMTNTNFYTKEKIVPDSMQNLDKKDQWDNSTSLTARKLGEIFNLSPKQIDNFWRTATGGAGQNALKFSDEQIAKATGVKPDEIKGRGVLESLAGRFYAPKGTSDGAYYYQSLDEAMKANKLAGRDLKVFETLTAKKWNSGTHSYEGKNEAETKANYDALYSSPAAIKAISDAAKWRAAKTGEPLDPLYNLPLEQQRYHYLVQATPKGSVEQKDLQNKAPWYSEFKAARAAYFDAQNINGGNSRRVEYQEMKPEEQAIIDQYFDMENGQAKWDYNNQNRAVIDRYFDNLSRYTNEVREAQGYAPLKPQPRKSEYVQMQMDNKNWKDPAVQRYMMEDNLWKIESMAGLAQLQGNELDSKTLKAIKKLGQYNIFEDAFGEYHLGFKSGGGYGSGGRKRASGGGRKAKKTKRSYVMPDYDSLKMLKLSQLMKPVSDAPKSRGDQPVKVKKGIVKGIKVERIKTNPEVKQLKTPRVRMN